MNDIIEAISCEKEIIQLKLLNVPKHPKMIAKIFSILKDEEINIKKVDFIKVQRSQIYNPDFKYLYKILGAEQGLLAFELFIFENGYKVVIYSDGKIELYLDENKINKIEMQQYLYNVVKGYVTVVRR